MKLTARVALFGLSIVLSLFLMLRFSGVIGRQDKTLKQNNAKTKMDVSENKLSRKGFFDSLDRHMNDPLHVFIVEEHHEVLPYWIEASNHGILPKRNVTLIHIDGHSDMAEPIYISGFPFFVWPSGKREIRYMLQTNDVFIVEAGILGLVQNIIWVWPKWDDPNHEKHYTKYFLEIGWALVKEPDNKVYKVFCVCGQEYDEDMKSCFYISTYTISSKEEEKKINAKYCNIKNRILFEEIREDLAVRILKERKYSNPDQAIILDIDEDFFGCTYASMPLVDSKANVKTVKKINELLMNLFCPVSPKGEQQLDSVLVKVIESYKFPLSCKLNTVKCSHNIRQVEARAMLKHHMLDWMPYTCTISTARRSHLLRSFFTLISKLTFQQLSSLQTVGFCLRTSPKGILSHFINETGFGICLGQNSPNHTSVLEHKTNSAEIFERTESLQAILRSAFMSKRPNLVTLCRSIRDGYTPREYFTKIESSILKVLSKQFWNIHRHYDDWLLGGEHGWRPKHT